MCLCPYRLSNVCLKYVFVTFICNCCLIYQQVHHYNVSFNHSFNYFFIVLSLPFSLLLSNEPICFYFFQT